MASKKRHAAPASQPRPRRTARAGTTSLVPPIELIELDKDSSTEVDEPVPAEFYDSSTEQTWFTECATYTDCEDDDDDECRLAAIRAKRANYYVVEVIFACRDDNGSRKFRVGWHGFGRSDDSWEPEEFLDGSAELLNKFCDKNNIQRTTVKFGSIGGELVERDNWVGADWVLSAIGTWRKLSQYRSSAIPVNVFSDHLAADDHIYLVEFKNHLFVALWLPSKKLMMVSDGANVCVDDRYHMKWLSSKLKSAWQPIKFMKQSGVDHCASSAVIIALEFMQIHASSRRYEEIGWPTELCPSSKLFDQIRSRAHKLPSKPLTSSKVIFNFDKKSNLSCPFCGFSPKIKNKLRVVAHIHKCPERPKTQ